MIKGETTRPKENLRTDHDVSGFPEQDKARSHLLARHLLGFFTIILSFDCHPMAIYVLLHFGH
jgi:hypothetical protein